ncbi:Fic family protein [Pedobacter frigoris]|uniref:Fic family protein n=1 Tax=Pedobacter frigoris TaxID=2571272 RepID=A0A4U1CLY4_9SPHI|nr:Fic family protein [Pedobacter frigoris]TKC08851.1 Fic family protein [Pedobacter frigoris]
MSYNWQLQRWPDFIYNLDEVQPLIVNFAKETGEVNGIIQALPEEMRLENLLQLMLSEAIKTSEIEGEYLSREDVMSSIRNNLGLNESPVLVKDQQAAGIGRLMVDVRKSFQEPLSIITLKYWHELLMENAKQINAGEWRTGAEPMQVISGAYGKETIHYEAPPSSQVENEMLRFVDWFNSVEFGIGGDVAEAVLRAAVSHLYFESIHPFEDGNGRIGRAIAEKALSCSLGRPVMLSLSKAIEKDRKRYYAELKKAQAGLEITEWMIYFASVILEAQIDAKTMVQFTLKKAFFFDRYKSQLNERQLKVINKMLASGADGFEGGMTAAKYMRMAKISKATATRDLQYLHEIGVLLQEGLGRSVRYQITVS